MLLGSEPDTKLVKEELPYWLALNQRAYYFPASLIAKGLERFSSLQNLWRGTEAELLSLGFDKKSVRELAKIRNESTLIEMQKLVDIINARKINVLLYTDPKYPQQLRNIAFFMNPPLLLFHRGSEFDFGNCAAVVGTRVCSFHGRSMARKIGKKFGDMGFTVVSGLARGADVEAHMGALESKGGKTISVLAWFDPIYPEEHSELVQI